MEGKEDPVPLAKRIMATLLIRNGMLVKGRHFAADRVVGSPIQAVRVFEMRQADELVILDVGASREGGGPDFDLIKTLANDCFMPLAVGGGVRSIQDVRELLRSGADKVVFGSATIENPEFIREAAEAFGSNCVVLSVDFCSWGQQPGLDYLQTQWILRAEALGAGEILLQSIDRDGTMAGYDLEALRIVTRLSHLPMVASGGCSGYEDMARMLEAGADAVTAGALWQFTEATPMGAKRYLRAKGFNVRLT